MKNKISLLFLIIALLLVYAKIMFQPMVENTPPTVNFKVAEVEKQFSDSKVLKTTAFSSVECRTTWCRANPERNGHQVALNAKYGKASKVYIQELNQTYDVIGTTDEKTELDVYYGTNGQGAREFGVKYLHIILL